jgi:uncharacterized protein YpmS
MHNFHYLQSSFNSWKIVAILGAVLLFIFFIIMIIRRYDIGSNGLTGLEKKSLPREEQEILSMLRQHGNSMLQTEVADTIAGDLTYIVDILVGLEKKGKVQRRWDVDRSSYLVSAIG